MGIGLPSPSISSCHLSSNWKLDWGLWNSLLRARGQLPQRSLLHRGHGPQPSVTSNHLTERKHKKGKQSQITGCFLQIKRHFFSHDFPPYFLLIKVVIIMELKCLLGQLQIGYMTFFFLLYDILGYFLHQRNKEKFSANSFKFCSTLLTFFSTSQFLKAVWWWLIGYSILTTLCQVFAFPYKKTCCVIDFSVRK